MLAAAGKALKKTPNPVPFKAYLMSMMFTSCITPTRSQKIDGCFPPCVSRPESRAGLRPRIPSLRHASPRQQQHRGSPVLSVVETD